MKLHRAWSCCAILLTAVSVASCAQGQNLGQILAQSVCGQGKGPVSASPEYCLYVTDLQIHRDSSVQVGVSLVSRTNSRLLLVLNKASLSDNLGNHWTLTTSSGIPRNGGGMALLDPSSEVQGSINLLAKDRPNPGSSFVLDGEIYVYMSRTDSKGNLQPGSSASPRGFRVSGLQVAQQPTQLQQGSMSAGQSAQAIAVATELQQNVSSKVTKNDPSSTPMVAIPTAAPSASGVMPMAGSRTWDSVDIVGLKIGISPDEYRQSLMKNDPPLEIQTFEAELVAVPNTKHTSYLVGASKEYDPSVGRIEIMSASFAPVPNKSVAGVIGRVRAYAPGQQPTVENVRKALIEKYGSPSIQQNIGSGDWELLIWAFDKDGNQLAGPGIDEKCSSIRGIPNAVEKPSQSLFSQDWARWGAPCGRAIVVRINLDFMKKNNLVWRMSTVLLDPFMIEESLIKTDSMVSEYKKRQRDKELEGAQKQGKPKL